MAAVFYQEIGNTTQISGVILVNQPNMESARTEVRLFAGIGTILDTCTHKKALLHVEIASNRVMRTEEPLFRPNEPIMAIKRTEDPLLHHNHG